MAGTNSVRNLDGALDCGSEEKRGRNGGLGGGRGSNVFTVSHAFPINAGAASTVDVNSRLSPTGQLFHRHSGMSAPRSNERP